MLGDVLVGFLVLFESAVCGTIMVKWRGDVAPIGWLDVCSCRGQ